MKKSFALAFAVVLAGGFAIHRLRTDGWAVTELFTTLYSERGSIHCGHATNSPYHGPTPKPEAVIACAQNAQESHRALTVMFTAYGTDDEISNALIVRKNGTAVEIFYAVGTVETGKTLVRHHCDSPTRLVIEKGSPVGFPRLHCAEWPPRELH